MNKIKNRVPALRFVGFTKKWEPEKIKDVLEYEQPTKYIVNSERYENVKNINNIPVLTANKGFVLGYTAEREGVYKNGSVVIFDDFTMDMKYVDFPFKVKSSAIKILKNRNSVSLKFMYEKLVSLNLTPESHKRNYISVVQEMMVFVPSSEEQTKIAEFFTTLDERIQTQQSIVENLEKLKKGYMQKIFSQELRFKDENGEDFPEWEPMAVGNMLLDYSERVGGRSIQAVSVGTLGIRKRSDIFSKELSNDLSGNKVFRKNQICFGLGTNNIVYGVLIDNETFCVSPAYKIFNIVNVSPLFFEKLMDFHNKRLSQLFMIKSARQGKTVDFDSLLQDRVLICSSKEQNIIVQYFLILEKKLELEKNKLLKFQELKHGYLQKMFV